MSLRKRKHPPFSNAKQRRLSAQIVFLLGIMACIACTPPTKEAEIDTGLSQEQLNISPKGPVEVGVFESVDFSVQLLDERKKPITGTPIAVSFTSTASNATLTPDHFITDTNGKGTIRFTAPFIQAQTESVSYEIRFQSPSSEVYVPVVVNPDSVKLVINVAYNGKREIHKIEAQLFEDTTDSAELQSIESTISDLPWELEFPGLIQETNYIVKVTGLNALDNIRVTGEQGGMIPNTIGNTITLKDYRLSASGLFQMTTELFTKGKLDWLVDTLFENMSIIENPAGAILDGIELELSDNAFAQANFNLERENQNLDKNLEDRIEEAAIELNSDFETVTDIMKESLLNLVFEGSLELGTLDADTLSMFHQIQFITFDPPNAVNPVTATLELPETAQETALWGEFDSLVINEHSINLGLGTPLNALLVNVLTQTLGVNSITKALEARLSCPIIAEHLKNYLSDVAIPDTIEWGCNRAISDASKTLESNAESLNQDAALNMKGHCNLIIPEEGNQIQSLAEGVFSARWVFGDEVTDPMDATFSATLPVQ